MTDIDPKPVAPLSGDPAAGGAGLIAEVAHAEEFLGEDELVKKKLGIGFWIAIVWMVVVVVLALLAPTLFENPNSARASSNLPDLSPSTDHLFGTDRLGRDVFGRVMWGSRISLVVGFSAIAGGMLIGGVLGIMGGFLGGWFDRITSFLFLGLLSFPALVLALLILTSIDRTLFWICVTLGILSVAPIGRLARAQTLTYAKREFVTAATALGAKRGRIMLREILPNVMPAMAALALLGMAVAIVAEGSLAFLGITDPNKYDSWGGIIFNGSELISMEDRPWVAFGAILVLFGTVLSLNFIGDRLREYFDARELSL